MVLHLWVPFEKPISFTDFGKFNDELQAVCDKYGLGTVMVVIGSDDE
ncbi:MAG: hypothetical protein IJI96_02620 [Methanobrevibacter sp.]|nr:hypothetical protein [Methanobrevibacter sp.]MBQ6627400.1 hypothetical protein [Methanobrevibacter sp.]